MRLSPPRNAAAIQLSAPAASRAAAALLLPRPRRGFPSRRLPPRPSALQCPPMPCQCPPMPSNALQCPPMPSNAVPMPSNAVTMSSNALQCRANVLQCRPMFSNAVPMPCQCRGAGQSERARSRAGSGRREAFGVGVWGLRGLRHLGEGGGTPRPSAGATSAAARGHVVPPGPARRRSPRRLSQLSPPAPLAPRRRRPLGFSRAPAEPSAPRPLNAL